jgi:hypothetical protein
MNLCVAPASRVANCLLLLSPHDDRIEIRPVGPSSSFKRRGDVHPTQPDFDPIGRYGYLLDNVPDEAFITTGGAASHRSESLDAWLCHVSGFHLLPLSSRRESGYAIARLATIENGLYLLNVTMRPCG